MAVKYSPKAHSREKTAQSLSKQEKVVAASEAQYIKKHHTDYLSRKMIVLCSMLACIILGWAIGLVSWGFAYISCGEAPVTRRNELMVGTVYYKPGSEGYGLASPIFKGGNVCSDSQEYKRAVPPELR